jgi:hemoglobin
LKKDILNRADIEIMVNTFYRKVLADKLLGFIFQDVARVNWVTHLPVMYNFWENVIFYTGSYEGNPLNLHKHLHHITPLGRPHFDRWNKLFVSTVDELFEGPNAGLVKERALSISEIMRVQLMDYKSSARNNGESGKMKKQHK